MKQVEIYTDGSCKCNPGPGGWCAILVYNGREKVISGGESNTTNNRMELMAVIVGLEALTKPCQVTVVSDSKYVTDAFNQHWVDSWLKNNWKNKKEPRVVLFYFLVILDDWCARRDSNPHAEGTSA